MGQILGYYEGSVEEFVADGLDQSTPSGDITFILGNGDEGDGFCTQNKVFKCGGGDNVYIFNPDGVASEEYAGLQDAVNNGKMVAINMDGLTAPCVLIPSESGIIVQVELAMSNTQESGASSYMLTFNSMSYLVTEDGIALYNSGTAILGGGDGTQVLTNSASYSSLKTINGESILGRGNIAIEGGSDITVDDTLNANSTNPVQNKAIVTALNSIAEVSNSAVQPDDLATVATSGSYNDLSDKPTIPSVVTESTVSGWGFTKNAGTITGVSINGTTIAKSGNVYLPNASTSAYGVTKLTAATNSTSTNLAATASAVKAAYDLANGKQDKLTSGTNIKTINGQSLLGSGDITISGGSGGSGGSSAYSEVSHGTSDTTFTLTPNVFHVWDEVSSLTLTLGDETAGVANEFLFQFNSGGEGTTLTLPDTIKWANDSAPTIETNKIYQISILKGLASALVFDNAPNLIDNIATYSEGNMMSGATLTFQYPVASDLTIGISGGVSSTMTISAGETSITIDWYEPMAPTVKYIIPSSDSVYNYILG